MSQKFYASPTDTITCPNGAVGHRAGGAFDCLGPYAKVRNCPVAGTALRLTCYASNYADTYFSVPANTRHRGKTITGFFTHENGNIVFHPHDRHAATLGIAAKET